MLLTTRHAVHTAQVLNEPEFNKYAHMEPPINDLTIFEWFNQAALAQVMLDHLLDGAMVIRKNGDGWRRA